MNDVVTVAPLERHVERCVSLGGGSFQGGNVGRPDGASVRTSGEPTVPELCAFAGGILDCDGRVLPTALRAGREYQSIRSLDRRKETARALEVPELPQRRNRRGLLDRTLDQLL